MNGLRYICLLLVLLWTSTATRAPVWGDNLPLFEVGGQWRSQLQALPGGEGMESAFVLADDQGRSILEWDARRVMLPASTLKLATAAGILQQQGQQQQLTTRLQLWGQRVRSLGDYDPELTSSDLEELALQLAPRLIDRVEIEVCAPDPQPYAPGWVTDDLSSSFAPPISNLVFDHGLIPLRLLAGEQLQVAGPPWAPAGNLGFIPRAGEFELLVLPGWDGWVMAGQIPPGVEEAVTMPMLRPELAVARLLGEVFQRRGLKVDLVAPTSGGTPTFQAEHRSRSVQQILAQGLADSDNLVLECLYRRFGSTRPKCWQGATQRVVDGSGLSRYNLVSARQLLQLLESQPDLLDYLPRAGQDGTMKRRFVGTPLEMSLRAKTGTMSGVSGLVGEFAAVSGKRYRFALLLNGYVGSSLPFKQAEEKLLLRLAALL